MDRLDLEVLLVLGLAAWRITSLVYWEEGPFAVFYHFRRLLGVDHGADRKPRSYPTRGPGAALACFWCASMWAALCLVGLYLAFPKVAMAAALVPALSAMAIILREVINGTS